MTNERYTIMPAGLIHQFTTSFRLALTLVLLAGALGIATLAPTRSAVAQTAGSGSAVIEIDAAGCNTDAAINAAIGQSFKLPSAAALKLDNISIWIGPAQDRETSYELALLRGEGPMGSLLKTSSIVKLGGGEQARWHGFTFSGVTLQPGPSYTFVLVSRSSVSGTFAQCKDKYPDGSLHRPVEGRDSSADVAFKIFGVSTAATDQIALPLPPPPAPGEPAQVLPPKIAELAAKGLLGAKRTVMPLGDSITDMPAGVDPNDWAGPAWGGYRKEMANNGVFNALFQLVGSYGVYQYQSTASPWPPTMPGDQRSHCGWSGATMDGYTIPPATSNISPGTSIIGNFWQCKADTLKIFPKLDYVLMHAGTNDLWDIVPNPNPEPPGVRGNKVADKTIGLIQHILADTQAKVLVAKLIPMTRDQAVFNPNVIAYNEALGVKITMRQTWPSPNAWTWLTRVKIVDMYQAFQDGTDNDPKEVMLDGLHPDVPGNKILAYEWMAAIYANP